MSIPTQRDIEIPLLHLIYNLGGEVSLSDTYKPLADYFNLSFKEQNEFLPSGISKRWENRVNWARLVLTQKGFLDSSIRGIWKITEKGKNELARLGLLNNPFPQELKISYKRESPKVKNEKPLSSEYEELIQLVIEEVLPEGNKTFPDDFIDTDKIKLREIDVPGTELHINPYSKTLVVSPKGYFRHQAKNPPEAKYIIYANKRAQKNIKIPEDNLLIFKAVTKYEKYVTDTLKKCFELFLDFTYDESKAEFLTQIVKEKLNLKEKI
jgi:hypothetical protein